MHGMKHNPVYTLLSHCSVSLHNTEISFSAAFINITCRQSKNCNNFCPRSNLKIQSTMATESTVTPLLPFPEKITFLKLLRGGTTESKLNTHTCSRPHLSSHCTEQLMTALQGEALGQCCHANKVSRVPPQVFF